ASAGRAAARPIADAAVLDEVTRARLPPRSLGLFTLRRAHAHRSGRHRSRCDRGRAARRTGATTAITARTDGVVHAELNGQLASSSRDDVLASACPCTDPRRLWTQTHPS